MYIPVGILSPLITVLIILTISTITLYKKNKELGKEYLRTLKKYLGIVCKDLGCTNPRQLNSEYCGECEGVYNE